MLTPDQFQRRQRWLEIHIQQQAGHAADPQDWLALQAISAKRAVVDWNLLDYTEKRLIVDSECDLFTSTERDNLRGWIRKQTLQFLSSIEEVPEYLAIRCAWAVWDELSGEQQRAILDGHSG